MRFLLTILLLLCGRLQAEGFSSSNSSDKPVDFSEELKDSFNHLIVSHPKIIFSSKRLYGKKLFYWSETYTGTGTVAFDSAGPGVTITCGQLSTDWSINQTKTYWDYIPGIGQEINMSINPFGLATANAVKRWGYFDDLNGLFWEVDSSTIKIVQRCNGVDTPIPRSSWRDRLDGTGNSRVNLDLTKANIFSVNFQWLGVGLVRFGILAQWPDRHIRFTSCYEFSNPNTLISPYMRTSNLPLRCEVRNSGATSANNSFANYCDDIHQYANGIADPGLVFSADRNTSISGAAGVVIPILAIRLKAGYTRAHLTPLDYSAIGAVGDNALIRIYMNPTILAGTPVWRAVSNGNSIVEYTTSSYVLVTTNAGCMQLDSDTLVATQRKSTTNITNYFYGGASAFDPTVADIFVLTGEGISGGSTYLMASMTFKEDY